MVKTSLIVALVLSVGILLIATAQHLIKQEAAKMTIETKGLPELEIELAAPYGTESMEHVLLINRGPHYLLACDIRFEATSTDGRVLSARKVLYSYPLFESDPSKRMKLLKLEPGIHPNSRWLIGFDETGLQPVISTVPPFQRATVKDIFPKSNYKHLVITLSGAMTETGEVYGPLAKEFLEHIEDKIRKENKP
ncbi:MAG TPA: hypothetical protein VJT71_18265 [Pyrinomonadaceae bacterium]|nr:hypothetical protein [Pyrinomonadaceae bacterium]